MDVLLNIKKSVIQKYTASHISIGHTLCSYTHLRSQISDNYNYNINTHTFCLSLLTISAGGEVDGLTGRRHRCQCADAVEGEHGEGVGGVRAQPPHHHPPPCQLALSRPVTHALGAGRAGGDGGRGRGGGGAAAKALDGVGEVGATAALLGLAPLQGHGGVVDLGDDAAWGRGGLWRGDQIKGERSEVIVTDMAMECVEFSYIYTVYA